MAQDGEDVYATLITTDDYLPGALVLAHSLRDAGTAKKLVVLVTLDTVTHEAIRQLATVYDSVIAVPRLTNRAAPEKLALMQRPDLAAAFTKVQLWNQTQFRRVVYVDADVVALRAPDELFALPHAFAAAPDIGWPDIFNSGVMVLTPNYGDYAALSGMAQRGASFDGADQGLLNMYYKNRFHRLPFTYNVTPSPHYQYLPAYRHFQAGISMVHFIGPDKPWRQGRQASEGGGVYSEMVGHWWAVYDRHYASPTAPPEFVQYFVKGEYNPTITYTLPIDESPAGLGPSTHGQNQDPDAFTPLPPSFSASYEPYPASHHPPPSPIASHQAASEHPHHGHHGHDHHVHHGHDHHVHHYEPPREVSDNTPPPPTDAAPFENTHTETHKGQDQDPPANPPRPAVLAPTPTRPPMEPSWDAQWQAPPANAKPEAQDFPQTRYEMSRDTAPFVPPPRYPSPPRDMWYEVPKTAPAAAAPGATPATVFPWEGHQPAPTRYFAPAPALSSAPDPAPTSEPTEPPTDASTAATSSPSDASSGHGKPGLFMPLPAPDPWASFTRVNAWDDVPQIERYVEAFQKKHGRTKSRGGRLGGAGGGASSGAGDGDGAGAGDGPPTALPLRHGSRVTDFPSEVERPSLPVTPAPVRRRNFWGGDDGDDGDDAGSGAGGGGGGGTGDRLVAVAPGVPQQADWDPATQLQKLAEEQSRLLLQKLGHPAPSTHDDTHDDAHDGAHDDDHAHDHASTTTPAYLGPGLVFEKNDGVPTHGTTPALPSEEELDVFSE